MSSAHSALKMLHCVFHLSCPLHRVGPAEGRQRGDHSQPAGEPRCSPAQYQPAHAACWMQKHSSVRERVALSLPVPPASCKSDGHGHGCAALHVQLQSAPAHLCCGVHTEEYTQPDDDGWSDILSACAHVYMCMCASRCHRHCFHAQVTQSLVDHLNTNLKAAIDKADDAEAEAVQVKQQVSWCACVCQPGMMDGGRPSAETVTKHTSLNTRVSLQQEVG